MLAKFAFYCLVLPLSFLPMWILYLFTDFFFLIIITVFPYRKSVIESNIKNSFPSYSERERKKLKLKFYRHFTDLLAEGIKNLSISKKELSKRLTVTNPEIMNELYNNNKSVLLVSGHYNNWEWLISAQDSLFPHQAYGIGKRMSSKFWDKKVNERRSRFGMNVIHSGNYREALSEKGKPKSVLVLADQSPGNSSKSYWTQFLNQQTAVLFGVELMAHELDFAVVYFSMKKIRRGYYEMTLNTVTAEPKQMAWGEITEAHTHLLEIDIIDNPEYWLWSHKRWKREIPDNLESLINSQRTRFNEKFNK